MISVLLNLMINSESSSNLVDWQLFMHLITFSLKYFPLLPPSMPHSPGFPPTSLAATSQSLLTGSYFFLQILNVGVSQSLSLDLPFIYNHCLGDLIQSHGFTYLSPFLPSFPPSFSFSFFLSFILSSPPLPPSYSSSSSSSSSSFSLNLSFYLVFYSQDLPWGPSNFCAENRLLEVWSQAEAGRLVMVLPQ